MEDDTFLDCARSWHFFVDKLVEVVHGTLSAHDSASAFYLPKTLPPAPDAQVAFVLDRHQSVDVRSLLEQDVLLLRALCLSPAAAQAGLVAAAHRDGGGRSPENEVVVRCWWLHVDLLVNVLRRMPSPADDSLAVVTHVALPCFEALAAVCLDGIVYHAVKEGDLGSGTVITGAMGLRAAAATVAAETPSRTCSMLGQVLLRQVLRASADAWTPEPSGTRCTAAATCGGGGALWRTPSQVRNARLARRAFRVLVSAAGSAPSRGSQDPLGVESAVGMESQRVAAPPKFPNHWLLRFLANRQSSVLRRYAGLVLGALTASKGAEYGEEMAEAAAHLLSCVGAEGSEPAALQVRSAPRGIVSGRRCGIFQVD